MRIRLEDVAKRANVHPATASRALSERTRHLVSDETSSRVLQAAAELNYLPNTAAASLASSRSFTVGVVVADLAVPLFADMLRGIDDTTMAAGYSTLIVDTNNDPERELRHLSNLESRRVDGLVVTTSTVGDPDQSARFTKVAPTVSLLRASAIPSGPEVVSNDDLGMRLIVGHLTSLGHERIALVAGPPTLSTALSRLRGYRSALMEHGLSVDSSLIHQIDRIDADHGRRAAAHLVRTTDCTAIVGFNDLVTFGILKELRALGIDCPEDISVVGYSDIPTASLVHPALTTVAVDHYQMGVEAARLLLEMVNDPSRSQGRSIQFPVTLVVRDSTAPAATRSPALPEGDDSRA